MSWGAEVFNSVGEKTLDLTTPTVGIIVGSFRLGNSYSGTITVPETAGYEVFLMLDPANSHGIPEFPFIVTPRVRSHNKTTGAIGWEFLITLRVIQIEMIL